MNTKIRIGSLISGGGTNLQAILDSCADNKIDATMLFTGSDNKDAKGLKRAEKAGVKTFIVDYPVIIKNLKENPDSVLVPDDFNLEEIKSKQKLLFENTPEEKINHFLKSRAIAEKQLLDHIIDYDIDLLVLAGFMRTLTPYFIDRFCNSSHRKIMNIHPALLPSFPGVDGYGDTFNYGCKVGGCTVHFIDYGEDTGPILGQKAFDIEDSDTLADIKKKGLELEWQLFPECIQKFAESLRT
ncbi:MAG: phosphoribosylglycinamide formyltransferase [Desulfobacterales bacterium]|nr:phosphoribosylglycinamide formyltransferase [Desulfobacterales bacterium]